jgi:hypothetical protein
VNAFALSTNNGGPQRESDKKGPSMLDQLHMAAGDFRAEYVWDELDLARGAGVAYHVSHALHALHAHSKPLRAAISTDRAAAIVRAIEAASPGVPDLFRIKSERVFAMQAPVNAQALARHCAGNGQGGDGGPDAASLRNDARAVLWLRNCCHTFSLLDEIIEFHARLAKDARLARFCEVE